MVLIDPEKNDGHGSEICERCGWYASRFAHNNCNPVAGRIANALAAQVPEIDSTKLGYGEGKLTFEIAEGLNVSFRIRGIEPYAIAFEDLHCLGDLSIEQAARLVRAIKEIVQP